jgi:hypothetical protein
MGALLVTEALRQLKDGGAAGCVLLGDPAYYARFGFRPVPGLGAARIFPGPRVLRRRRAAGQRQLPRGLRCDALSRDRA